MACLKQEIAQVLPLYVNCRISEAERTQVEEHLRECEDCRREFLVLRSFAATFKRQQPGFEHIEEEKLVAYCGDRSGLSPGEVDSIEKHLSVCSNCAREAAALREINRRLEGEVSSAKGIRLRFAFAALLIIVFIIGALIYIRHLERSDKPKEARQGTPAQPEPSAEPKPAPDKRPGMPKENITTQHTPPTFTLRATTDTWRDENPPEENHIRLSAKETAFTLSFLVAVTTDPMVGYDLEILEQGGRTVISRKDVKSVDAVGHFQETVQREYFKNGTYLLKVSEINRRNLKTIAEYFFPFKLTLK